MVTAGGQRDTGEKREREGGQEHVVKHTTSQLHKEKGELFFWTPKTIRYDTKMTL